MDEFDIINSCYRTIDTRLAHLARPKGTCHTQWVSFMCEVTSRNIKTKLKRCKELLGISENHDQIKPQDTDWIDLFLAVTGIDLRVRPVCNEGRMLPKTIIPSHNHSPP